MDRVEFLHSIKGVTGMGMSIATETIIKHFFDQYMLVYNLIGGLAETTILNTDNKGIVVFQLEYSNPDDLLTVIQRISDLPQAIQIYDSVFHVTWNQNSETGIVFTIMK